MKKTISISITLFIILTLAASGYCQDAAKKLGRGIVNIVTCPSEIPIQMTNSFNKEKSIIDCLFYGLPKGVLMTVVRCAAGAYDTVSFPVPFPGDYGPVLEPEYAWGD